MAQRIEGAEGKTFFPSLRSGWQDWQQMLESAAALYAQGITLDWNTFDNDYDRRRVPLPTYPWQNTRYWISDPAVPEPTRTTPEAKTATTEEGSILQELRQLPPAEAQEAAAQRLAADRGHSAVGRAAVVEIFMTEIETGRSNQDSGRRIDAVALEVDVAAEAVPIFIEAVDT